jgi:hypothetical protein
MQGSGNAMISATTPANNPMVKPVQNINLISDQISAAISCINSIATSSGQLCGLPSCRTCYIGKCKRKNL